MEISIFFHIPSKKKFQKISLICLLFIHCHSIFSSAIVILSLKPCYLRPTKISVRKALFLMCFSIKRTVVISEINVVCCFYWKQIEYVSYKTGFQQKKNHGTTQAQYKSFASNRKHTFHFCIH